MPPTFLALQHETPEGLGRIAPVLAERDVAVRIVRRDLDETIPEAALDHYEGLIVLGGAAGVPDIPQRPDLAEESEVVQQALISGIPTLGICLGSQLMAAALGAQISTGSWELGWSPISRSGNGEVMFKDLPQSFPALHWHRDVFTLPPGATGLASSPQTQWQAFEYGPHLGMLFHLEVDPEQTAGMVSHLGADVSQAGLKPPQIIADAQRFQKQTAAAAEAVFGRWVDVALRTGRRRDRPI